MLRKKLMANTNPKKCKLSNEIPTPNTENCKSPFFPNLPQELSFEQKILNIQLELNAALQHMQFKPPAEYVYNPVEYAFKGNESYIRKYCRGPKKVLFVGMNPGPFGMCQTGVPFGEVNMVRDWLGIEEQIGRPSRECPQREIKGFKCTRSEESGKRFWGLLRKLCGTPEVFFKNCFIYNYCPLAFLKLSAKRQASNVTPDQIDKVQQKELETILDEYFTKVLDLINPELLVAIGGYAEKRCRAVMKTTANKIEIIRLLHPSPRVPNNQNWSEKAEKFFVDQKLLKYFK